MDIPNWVVAIVAAAVALLQALVLFILKDMKNRIERLVGQEVCSERHKSIDRRLTILESESVAVRRPTTTPPPMPRA
jgi:hypothetical protein